MADVLREAEKAAIAAFRGEITRVPRGASGEAYFVYDEKATTSGGLVASEPMHARDQLKRKYRIRDRGVKFQALRRREEGGPSEASPPPVVAPLSDPAVLVKPMKLKRKVKPPSRKDIIAKRRSRVAELYRQDLTLDEIAAKLRVSDYTVTHDVRALKEAGVIASRDPVRREPAKWAEMREAVARRRETVLDLVRSGLTYDLAAKAVGVSPTTLMKDITALRAAGELPPARRSGRWG